MNSGRLGCGVAEGAVLAAGAGAQPSHRGSDYDAGAGFFSGVFGKEGGESEVVTQCQLMLGGRFGKDRKRSLQTFGR